MDAPNLAQKCEVFHSRTVLRKKETTFWEYLHISHSQGKGNQELNVTAAPMEHYRGDAPSDIQNKSN